MFHINGKLLDAINHIKKLFMYNNLRIAQKLVNDSLILKILLHNFELRLFIQNQTLEGSRERPAEIQNAIMDNTCT